MKYDSTKTYILNPTWIKYADENYNFWSSPVEDPRNLQYCVRLHNQLYELLDKRIPLRLIEDIWSDFSKSYCAQWMNLYPDAEDNFQRMVEFTDAFIEEV